MWDTTLPPHSHVGLGRPVYDCNIRVSMLASSKALTQSGVAMERQCCYCGKQIGTLTLRICNHTRQNVRFVKLCSQPNEDLGSLNERLGVSVRCTFQWASKGTTWRRVTEKCFEKTPRTFRRSKASHVPPELAVPSRASRGFNSGRTYLIKRSVRALQSKFVPMIIPTRMPTINSNI